MIHLCKLEKKKKCQTKNKDLDMKCPQMKYWTIYSNWGDWQKEKLVFDPKKKKNVALRKDEVNCYN